MRIEEIIEQGTKIADKKNVNDTQEIAKELLKNKSTSKEAQYLENKVKTYIENLEEGSSRDYVLHQIEDNKIVAAYFSKKASRQSVGEIAQIQYFKDSGKDIKKLPNTGKDSIRIGTPENKTKTIDAIVKNDYISFKYLKESGGAQANQISSVKTDLKIVKESIKNGTFRHTYIVILSGKYGVSKIPELRDKFQCPGIHICTCEDYCNI